MTGPMNSARTHSRSMSHGCAAAPKAGSVVIRGARVAALRLRESGALAGGLLSARIGRRQKWRRDLLVANLTWTRLLAVQRWPLAVVCQIFTWNTSIG
jgi:hypothetical protein